jgi:hypothetical protein
LKNSSPRYDKLIIDQLKNLPVNKQILLAA